MSANETVKTSPVIIAATRGSYRYIVKPLLFRFSPDDVHSGMLRTARVLGKRAVARRGIALLFRRNYTNLRQDLLGNTFRSPIGVSAGLDKNADMVPLVDALSYGFMTVGSVTAHECLGNARPWFQRLPQEKALTVHVGLANRGSATVLRQLASYKDLSQDFPVILSVAKTNSPIVSNTEEAIADYCTSIRRVTKSTAVGIIEINISCPNAYGGELFTEPHVLERLLTAVDEVVRKKPVVIKLPSDLPWPRLRTLLDVIVQHRVDGVTISNLAKDRGLLQSTAPESVRGGISGGPLKDLSNRLIEETYREYGGRLIIIGVGGVFTVEDAYDKIKKGASLVALVTGMIYNGPQLGADINRQLSALLERDGYATVSEAIGADIEGNVYTNKHDRYIGGYTK